MKKPTTIKDLIKMLRKYKDQDAPIGLEIDTEGGEEYESLTSNWPVIKVAKEGKRVVLKGVEISGGDECECGYDAIFEGKCRVCGHASCWCASGNTTYPCRGCKEILCQDCEDGHICDQE